MVAGAAGGEVDITVKCVPVHAGLKVEGFVKCEDLGKQQEKQEAEHERKIFWSGACAGERRGFDGSSNGSG